MRFNPTLSLFLLRPLVVLFLVLSLLPLLQSCEESDATFGTDREDYVPNGTARDRQADQYFTAKENACESRSALEAALGDRWHRLELIVQDDQGQFGMMETQHVAGQFYRTYENPGIYMIGRIATRFGTHHNITFFDCNRYGPDDSNYFYFTLASSARDLGIVYATSVLWTESGFRTLARDLGHELGLGRNYRVVGFRIREDRERYPYIENALGRTTALARALHQPRSVLRPPYSTTSARWSCRSTSVNGQPVTEFSIDLATPDGSDSPEDPGLITLYGSGSAVLATVSSTPISGGRRMPVRNYLGGRQNGYRTAYVKPGRGLGSPSELVIRQ